MIRKPIIIIVEDDTVWLRRLCKIISDNFEVEIEEFASFSEAEERLMAKPVNFHLLVADVFPDNKSREAKGLKFAKFVNEVINIPVIIITGEPKYVETAKNEYNVLNAFYKGSFEKMDFILSVSKIFRPKTDQSNPDKGNHEDPGYIS